MILELRADLLFHPRIGNLALSRRLKRNQLHNLKGCNLLRCGIGQRNDRRVLSGFQFDDALAGSSVGLLQRRLWCDANISAVRRRRAVLGVIHREAGKILSSLQACHYRLDLPARLGLIPRLVAALLALLSW